MSKKVNLENPHLKPETTTTIQEFFLDFLKRTLAYIIGTHMIVKNIFLECQIGEDGAEQNGALSKNKN